MEQTLQKPHVLGAEPLVCVGILPQSSNGPVGDLTGTKQQKSRTYRRNRRQNLQTDVTLQVSHDEGSLSV